MFLNKEEIIQKINSYNQEEYQTIKQTADLLLENKLRFIHNWDMERCEEPIDFSDFDWNKTYHGDPEWAYMANRMEYLLDLLVAYIYEDDIKYLAKLKEYIFNKIEDFTQNINQLDYSNRTLDTGIRVALWTLLLRIDQNIKLFSDKEIKLIKDSIVSQITYLFNNFNQRYYLSNWGSLQIVAVLQFNTLYPDLLQQTIIDFFEDALTKNLELSIYEDGVQWEQSIMYHIEVLIAFMNLSLFNSKYAESLNETLYRMAKYVYGAQASDYHQFAIGDSDCSDTRDILCRCAMYFNDPTFKSKAFKHPDIFSYFLFKSSQLNSYNSLESNKLKEYNMHFKDCGQIFLADQNFDLYFKNGPIGSSHTHSDLNSFCFHYKGQPIVIDSGRYTYKECEYRNFLKSCKAHSSIIIDDQCPEIIKSSWDFKAYPNDLSLELRTNDLVKYIESKVYGTINNQNYLHERYILKFKDKCLFIIDKVNMLGKHKADLRFILDNQITDLKDVGLSLWESTKYVLNDTVISKKYNDLQPSKMLNRLEEFNDNLYVCSIFYDSKVSIDKQDVRQTNSQEPFEGSFTFKIFDGQEYILNLNTNNIVTGSKVLKSDFNNLLTRGKCVIIDSSANKFIRIKA